MSQFPKWVVVARWNKKDRSNYNLTLRGFSHCFNGYPIQINNPNTDSETWEVLMSKDEYDQCPVFIKLLNQPIAKSDSVIDKINKALQDITNKIILEDTLNKLELISELLDDILRVEALTNYPSINALLIDLYNALLDSDSPLNR